MVGGVCMTKDIFNEEKLKAARELLVAFMEQNKKLEYFDDVFWACVSICTMAKYEAKKSLDDAKKLNID